MSTVRIALANLEIPATPEQSIALAERAIADASAARADLICFPECFIPGYRVGKPLPPPERAFLERAWSVIAAAAATANVAVVLGTERIGDDEVRLITTLVINRDGTIAGFQDKVQLDPSEEGLYARGSSRRVFHAGPLTFGIVICHEGWRYPETVRWAARHGAQIVLHPHFGEAEGGYQPLTFADPANTFHEKAALCRAAENSCFFATVNCASVGSPTTSAFVAVDGSLLSYQPYGVPGLLVADIDLTQATGLLAARCRS